MPMVRFVVSMRPVALGIVTIVSCKSSPRPANAFIDGPPTDRDAQPTEVPAIWATTLAAHNAARATVGTPALTWDAALADRAQSWASSCQDAEAPLGLVDHNADRSVGFAVYVGENVFGSSGVIANYADAVATWVSEAADYNADANTCNGVCGHYTQVVWRDTTSVGCGAAVCGGLQFGHTVVCNYAPGGNTGGRPF